MTAKLLASAALLIGLAVAPAQAGGTPDLLEPSHVAPAGCGFSNYRCITHPQKGRLCYNVPCVERRPAIGL